MSTLPSYGYVKPISRIPVDPIIAEQNRQKLIERQGGITTQPIGRSYANTQQYGKIATPSRSIQSRFLKSVIQPQVNERGLGPGEKIIGGAMNSPAGIAMQNNPAYINGTWEERA